MKLALTREGTTELYVPAESIGSRSPKRYPSFFNPAARVNRDVSVAIARATRPASFLDALAGTGARGVRVASEASKSVEVTLVEFNLASLRLARMNARRNRVAGRCAFVREEANAFLHSRFGSLERFEAVDLDPFGTPAPFLQGALNAAEDGGVVSLTATDTATLCGVYPKVALRRYGASVPRVEFAHEAAVRVLLGSCARLGGVVDTAIWPVAAHSTLHYVRVYFRVERGAARSERCLEKLGYVASCDACRERSVSRDRLQGCPRCGAAAAWVGPQWIGRLVEAEVVKEAATWAEESGWAGAAQALRALEGVDTFPPFAYSLEEITSRGKVSSVPFRSVVDALQAAGRLAAREPFGSGLKTDASYAEVVEAVTGRREKPKQTR